jgi:hypothetical protein
MGICFLIPIMFALFSCLAVGFFIHALHLPVPIRYYTVLGVLVSVDPKHRKLVATVSENATEEQRDFFLPSEAIFVRNGERANLEEFSPGTQVEITFGRVRDSNVVSKLNAQERLITIEKIPSVLGPNQKG